MEKITKLLAARVVKKDGTVIGRVIDVRSDGDPEHGLQNESRRVTEIIYRKRWFLQPVIFGKRTVRILPWSSVEKFSRGRVVVKEDAF